jgi:hypothetical protein
MCFLLTGFFLSAAAFGGEATSNSEGPRSACQRKCQNRARNFYRECRENGGTEERCQTAARELFNRCEQENCVPNSCEDRCLNEAVGRYEECVASGTEQDVCAARARHFLAECLDPHCDTDKPCQKRCENAGREMARLCVATGGTPEVCAQRAREFVVQCINEHCDVCGGIQGLGCGKNEFCKFPPGTCDHADIFGVCVVIPQACPLVYQPVCGCDGVTYGNECEAAVAGQSIDHRGPCTEVCGGIMGIPCPEGQFCQFRPGQCQIADNQGSCRPVPQACPDVYDPVCGCDGITYGNACEAAVAGQSIDHDGECHD